MSCEFRLLGPFSRGSAAAPAAMIRTFCGNCTRCVPYRPRRSSLSTYRLRGVQMPVVPDIFRASRGCRVHIRRRIDYSGSPEAAICFLLLQVCTAAQNGTSAVLRGRVASASTSCSSSGQAATVAAVVDGALEPSFGTHPVQCAFLPWSLLQQANASGLLVSPGNQSEYYCHALEPQQCPQIWSIQGVT